MSFRTKISTFLSVISFGILLIPIVLQKEIFLSDNFNFLTIGVFALSLATAIFSLIKEKQGISIILVFINSITLISLLSNTYDFQKHFLSDNTEEISDSSFMNYNYERNNNKLTEKQLLTDYQKATGIRAIAVIKVEKDYTVFLLSASKKAAPHSTSIAFDYEISEFASAELEARKSFSTIIIVENQTDFIVKLRQNSVAFFANGQNIGEENFHSQYQIIKDKKEIDFLRKISNYL